MSEEEASAAIDVERNTAPPGRDATILPFPSNRPPDATQDIGDTPLLRYVIGDVLRDERHRQERTLADVADDAAVSLAYLSEVERGRKEVSSDLLDAIGTALDLSLVEILERSAEHLRAGRPMSVRSAEFRVEHPTRFELAA